MNGSSEAERLKDMIASIDLRIQYTNKYRGFPCPEILSEEDWQLIKKILLERL